MLIYGCQAKGGATVKEQCETEKVSSLLVQSEEAGRVQGAEPGSQEPGFAAQLRTPRQSDNTQDS